MIRRSVQIAAALGAAALLGLVLAGIRSADPVLYPAPPGRAVPAILVSNGYHTGLLLPRTTLAETAGRDGLGALIGVAVRFEHYDWIEFGWGEDRFYRDVRRIADIEWRVALRALFWPGNATVMHVVGVEGSPRAAFAGATLVPIELSEEGFARLAAGIDRSFARNRDGLPEDLGKGLYGPSLFYRAVGTFSVVNLCNHWTAGRLGEAGLPVWPFLTTLPRGLILDLEWRAGVQASEWPAWFRDMPEAGLPGGRLGRPVDALLPGSRTF